MTDDCLSSQNKLQVVYDFTEEITFNVTEGGTII